MQIATDLIVSLCYKLWMFLEFQSLVMLMSSGATIKVNNTLPESVLTKKHNQICYHHACEAVAAGIIQITKQDSSTNLVDLLTKPLGLLQQ